MLSKSSSNGLFIVIFIFNLPLFEQASHHDRKYVHVATPMTPKLAKDYCRKHHTDLATFRNRNDLDAEDAVQTPCHKYPNYCWIGLQRDENNDTVWNWSDGDRVNFTNWRLGEPNDQGNNENCVVTLSLLWIDISCDRNFTFVCYDNLILVKENKTWEGALEHCRNLEFDSTSSNRYLHHHFDLPHVDFGVRNSVEKEVVLDSQTPEVWIGLRYLAGEWLWVNGMPLSKLLMPVCPAPGLYCGAMSKTGELLPPRNCLERRNFLCSKRV